MRARLKKLNTDEEVLALRKAMVMGDAVERAEERIEQAAAQLDRLETTLDAKDEASARLLNPEPASPAASSCASPAASTPELSAAELDPLAALVDADTPALMTEMSPVVAVGRPLQGPRSAPASPLSPAVGVNPSGVEAAGG
eukprot:scaffold145031_cov112-Phaeocystis_antarctica.AAC.1